jgi:hypothetical protein
MAQERYSGIESKVTLGGAATATGEGATAGEAGGGILTRAVSCFGPVWIELESGEAPFSNFRLAWKPFANRFKSGRTGAAAVPGGSMRIATLLGSLMGGARPEGK